MLVFFMPRLRYDLVLVRPMSRVKSGAPFRGHDLDLVEIVKLILLRLPVNSSPVRHRRDEDLAVDRKFRGGVVAGSFGLPAQYCGAGILKAWGLWPSSGWVALHSPVCLWISAMRFRFYSNN
ncbi:hypothetical protein B296_00045654 [Ensete ventricosum]|uniref:Uncharacterized protein n=1 Tax=Ensete ventricosum TaxID=4639 RepID=A0A426YAS3_ENSVE|nr:hypothetical protein B296_00045654 [Ensete ventricosum]